MKKLLRRLKIKKRGEKSNEPVADFFVDYNAVIMESDYIKPLTPEDYNGKVQ